MKKKCVLVAGGAGFIGSNINKILHQNGYNTVILDNLSSGNREAVIQGDFIHGDLADRPLLNDIFSNYQIDAVMHFAGSISVGESMKMPLNYYQNNVSNTLNLIEAMLQHEVNVFIFSSSAAIFGIPREPLITVNHPTEPISPYGHSKLMIETILKDVARCSNLKFSCLRYFNAAGGDLDGEIQNSKIKETNLIPIILKSLLQSKPTVTIFGTDYATPDGSCVRDYVHVRDLADAHITAMEKLFNGGQSSFYNLGNGKGFSVRQVIRAVANVTGHKINVMEGPRRPGDPPILLSCSEKAKKELGWVPQYPNLETMIEHSWKNIKQTMGTIL